MEKIRYNFESLDDPIPRHSVKIAGIDIPILIKIGDIKFMRNNDLDIGFDGDPMELQFNKIKELENYKWYLKFINNTDPLYEGYTKTFTEYYELNSTYDLLTILDRNDIEELISHISVYINICIEEFTDRLYDMLKIKDEKPEISYTKKYEMKPNIKDYVTYTQGYIIAQMGMEYNPTAFFPENKGKSILEWSYREFELHMAYLTIKSKIESTQDEYQAHINEKIMNEKK